MDKYILIHSHEDGLSISKPLTKSELQEDLKDLKEYRFMDADDINAYDFEYSGNAVIIKGEVVLPKPKQVVTEYDID